MIATLRPLAFALALAVSPGVLAAGFTYHGDLMDGDAPADGAYDLRVRSFARPGATKALGEATELLGVKVAEGLFSVTLDLPEDVDGTTWIEVAVRKAGSGEDYEVLGAPQAVSKVNSTCAGAWALDGNSGAPAGSYLGFADNRTTFVTSPNGVRVNSLTELDFTTDFAVDAKAFGDDDLDFKLSTPSGKYYYQSLQDDTGYVFHTATGGMSFFDEVPASTQNDGRAIYAFSGRLRSRAVGSAPTDTSGGIWFDDERTEAAFVGRGINSANWTGFFESAGGWRFTVHDNGAFGFNTGTTALPANAFKVVADGAQGIELNAVNPIPQFYDVAFGTRATAGDADFDVSMASRSGLVANISVFDTTGVMAFNTTSANTQFSFGAGNTAVAGRYLVTGASGAHLTAGGTWTNGSSRTFKHAFEAIDVGDVLARVIALPLSRWQYKGSTEGEHLGPMAEDFAAAFGLGSSPQHIGTVDADGVALAAIQGLNAKLESENTAIRRDNAVLRDSLDSVLARLARLEARGGE